MDENQFNQWVFRNTGQGTEEETEIALMVEAIDRTCHLSDEQKEKLRLAGHGDYARFKQEVDDMRAELVGKYYDQADIQAMYMKVQPLTARYQAGLLGDDSLFSKVLHRALTPEQRVNSDAAQGERRKARHVAKVHLFVALMEQNCPLTSKQRDALVDLLLKETRPATRSSEYDWYVVLIQVAKIPDEKLSHILDNAQMRFVKKLTGVGLAIEDRLKQQGVLPAF